jgi:hypothetical protein
MVSTFMHLLAAAAAFLAIQAVFSVTGWGKILATYVENQANGTLYALGALLVAGFLTTRVARLAMSKPVQYAAFLLFVSLISVLVAPLVAIAGEPVPKAPACAAILLLGGTIAVCAIALKFREEYRLASAMALWFVPAAALAGVAYLLLGLAAAMYAAAAVTALAGWSVLYTTRVAQEEYPRDRYIAAALELFAAIPLFPWVLLKAMFTPRR